MDILSEAKRLGLRWGRADGVPVARAAVVAEARTWMGTKFMHQHELKGHGVDCGGLIRGVSKALGLIPANYRDLMPSPLRGYGRQPQGDLGEQLCDHYWNRIDAQELRPGDVVIVRWGPHAQHGAIVTDYPNGGLAMIHALNGGPMKVVEHSMRWLAAQGAQGNRPRLAAAYSLPGVE